MLVSELRKEIKNYKTKDLEDIIVELYKRVPKYKKEEYNIDNFIKNIKSSKTQKSSKKKVTNLKIELKKTKNNSNLEYDLKEKINNCTKCILEIYCLMKEVDNGIAYFHKNYIERNQEIVEYVLLNKLYFLDLIDEWIKEYEDNVSKIDFRNSLKEQYILLKGQQNNSK